MEKVVSKQLDYKAKQYVKPTYRLSRIVPLSGAQSYTVSASGGEEVLFEIPSKAINLSRSILCFDVSVLASATANTSVNIFTDCLPFFRQIQLYTRSGTYLCDINDAHFYTKMTWRSDTKFEDFIGFDRAGTRVLNPHTSALRTITSVTTAFSGLLNVDSNQNYPPDSSVPDVPFLEPAYLERSAATSGLAYSVRMPLGQIYNTILSLDKDLLFDEVIILRLVANNRDSIGFCSVTGSLNSTATLQPTNITNLALMVAIETNDNIVNEIRDEKMTKGLSVPVNYIYQNKSALTGTSQNVSLRYNRAHGSAIKKIYHSIFLTAGSVNTAYDNNNTAGAKLTNFYTMIDNNRNQEINLTCASLDDFYFNQTLFKGSLILSNPLYYKNWTWLEDYSDNYCPSDNIEADNLISGLDLSNEKKWDFIGTTVAGNYTHVTYTVCQKMVNVSNAGIIVQ